MDRLLTPHRTPRLAPLNGHEILERVRSLILAEFSSGVAIRRDYDVSVPDLVGDKEQLIQAILNIVRNAAQALHSQRNAARTSGAREPAGGTIELRTRIARQITLVRQRHKLALELQVIDDGPGVAEDIRDKIFNPLVSGREGGSVSSGRRRRSRLASLVPQRCAMGLSQGQQNPEQSASRPAFAFDHPLVVLDESLRQRQAQAAASLAPGHEGIEDLVANILRDAGAVVDYLQF